MHRLEVTTGKVSDYSMAETLLHGDEQTAHGDRGYADKTREPDRRPGVVQPSAWRTVTLACVVANLPSASRLRRPRELKPVT